MKLKELKSTIVIEMAAPYIKSHGTKSIPPDHPRICVTVDSLQMQLSTVPHERPYNRLDIWDNSIGKKVFSADISPLEIIRCDTGKWFELFMTSFALQASVSIEKYIELREDLRDWSLKPGETGNVSTATLQLTNSRAH